MAMQLDNESREAVDYFWKSAGEAERFPRSLERVSILALPIAIIKLPRLALGSIESWLRVRNINYLFNCQSRPVRGCLIAFQDKGLLFCDGSDPLNEIRFTIAHEVSHFLLDYLLPRERAKQRYGQSVIEILDGKRKPTITERVSSLLEGVKMGVSTSLMEREAQRDISNIWKVEDRADRIALELLAPSKEVFAIADISDRAFTNRLDSITQSLVLNFGLPILIAQGYGDALLRSVRKGSSWTEAIRLSR
jgi:hypothetical protein